MDTSIDFVLMLDGVEKVPARLLSGVLWFSS